MKQVLYLITVLLVLAETSHAQDTVYYRMPNPANKSLVDQGPQKYSVNYYKNKSNKSRTAAWVLLSVGTVMGVTGMIVYEHNINTQYNLNQLDDAIANSFGEEFLIVAGSTMVLVSIPVFIASAHYRKKALEMSAILKLEPNRQPLQTGISMGHIPSMGINIRF